MKKLITLVSTCTVLAIPLAQAYTESNWLVGASMGYAERKGTLETTLDFTGTNPDITPAIAHFAFNPKHEDTGFIWGGLIGYQMKSDRWIGGLELNVDSHDIDKLHDYSFTDVAEWTTDVRYDRGTVVGLTARFGYETRSFLTPYIRLGAETSRDRLLVNLSALTTPELANRSIYMEDKHRNYRFVGGVGLEMPLPWATCCTARVEYNYHGKGNALRAIGMMVDEDDVLPVFAVNAKPETHSGKFSLTWNFA